MNCADIEILICDYVDGALPAAGAAEVKLHLAECSACAELARDAAAAVAFMESAATVEPPPELITRILFDAPWSKPKTQPAAWRKWFAGALSPILQPKFAMGMAMTILSLSMFLRFVPAPRMKASDWKPSAIVASIEDRATYAWGRTVKFYENLKFVYQIQNTLRQWQQQNEEQRPAAEGSAEGRKLPVKSTPGGSAAPGAPEPSDQTGQTR